MLIKGTVKQEFEFEVSPKECIAKLLDHYGFSTRCHSTFDGRDWFAIKDEVLYHAFCGESYASEPQYIKITDDPKMVRLYKLLSEAEIIINYEAENGK